MKKTIDLTPEEIEMIHEDIESTKEYFASILDQDDFSSDTEKEDFINSVNTADSILKKLL